MAKKLTKEQRGQLGFDFYQKVKDVEKAHRYALLQIGQLLHDIHENQMYKNILGNEEATWSEFLSDPAIYISRAQAYKLFLVFKKYLVELGMTREELLDIPLERLYEARQFVSSQDKDMLFKAQTLSSSDWKIALREAKGLPIEDDCTHKMSTYEICKNCGHKQQK